MQRFSHKSFKNFSDDKQLNVGQFNSITFYNQGDVTVKINSVIRLKPDMQIAMTESHPDVVDKTPYYINFDLSDPFTTGTNQSLIVITNNIHIE